MNVIFILAYISILIMISPILARSLKLPVVVVELLLGALSASFTPLLPHNANIEAISEVGFLFLMFLCGLEVNIRDFKTLNKQFILRALTYFLLLYIFSTTATIIFDLPRFYIVLFSIISVGMIMTLYKAYDKAIWVKTALHVGIAGELLSIVVIVVINAGANFGIGVDLIKLLLILMLFFGVFVAIIAAFNILTWWFPNIRTFILPTENSHLDIRLCFALFFTFIAISMALHVEAVLGAFMAGFLISNFFPHKHHLIENLNDFGFGFFVPLFFIHTGSTIDINIILKDFSILLDAIIIVGLMYLIRFISSLIAFLSYFKNFKNCLLYSLSDSMPLTFLVATATLGKNIEIISDKNYLSIVIASLLGAVIFNLAISLINKISHKSIS